MLEQTRLNHCGRGPPSFPETSEKSSGFDGSGSPISSFEPGDTPIQQPTSGEVNNNKRHGIVQSSSPRSMWVTSQEGEGDGDGIGEGVGEGENSNGISPKEEDEDDEDGGEVEKEEETSRVLEVAEEELVVDITQGETTTTTNNNNINNSNINSNTINNSNNNNSPNQASDPDSDEAVLSFMAEDEEEEYMRRMNQLQSVPLPIVDATTGASLAMTSYTIHFYRVSSPTPNSNPAHR